MTDADLPEERSARRAGAGPGGGAGPGRHRVPGNGPASGAGRSDGLAGEIDYRKLEVELNHVQRRIDGLRARMRAAVDLLGVLLLGLSGAALLVVTVLAVVGFAHDQTGVALIFSALAVVCLPLVAFAAWRAFRPLWLLSRELNTLHTQEQHLVSQLAAEAVRPAMPERRQAQRGHPGQVPPPGLPPGRSPTGFRPAPPRKGVSAVLSTRQVGWRVAVAIGVVMLLFAAGLLVGVLAR